MAANESGETKKLSSAAIEKQRRKLLKKTDRIVKAYAELDKALFYLSENQVVIKRDINNYVKLLKKANLQFLIGDNRAYGVLKKLMEDARADFVSAMSNFDLSARRERTTKLLTSVRNDYVQSALSYYNKLQSNLTSKMQNFKVIAETAFIPEARLREIADREIIQVRTAGKLKYYQKSKIQDSWDTLAKRYGMRDEVIYGWQQGKNIKFPLRSWVDMRTRTTSQEVHRLTTTVEASANGILTGKISAHGSKDSCIFHENRIVFFTQAGKDTFIEDHPDHTEAHSWPTVPELEADQTHIFKPNCRHIVTPYPFYLFDDKDAQEEIEQNPSIEIPENPEKFIQSQNEAAA